MKGHSNNAGNDRADDRVQWGEMDGPYCRFRSDGTFEGDFIDKPRPTSPKRSSLCTPSPSFRIHQFNRPASKARRNLFSMSTPVSPICVTCSPSPPPSSTTLFSSLKLGDSKQSGSNSHQAPTPKRFYSSTTSSITPQSDNSNTSNIRGK